MPRDIQGSVFKTGNGYGIRWPEDGSRPQKVGFRTKSEARDWFSDNVKPRLRRPGPSADIMFETFCLDYLERWGRRRAPYQGHARGVADARSRAVRSFHAGRARGRG